MALQTSIGTERTPSISATVVDVNPTTVALTGNANVLVRYCSNAQVTTQCQTQNDAQILSCFVVNNGQYYADNPAIIEGVEKSEFRVYAVDDWQRSNYITVIKSMVPYVKLTCSIGNNKPDGEGNMTVKVSGNYYAGSFGAQSNSLTVQYRYKLAGTSFGAWITIPASVGIRSYTAQVELTGLDYRSAYVFQARAIDKLATVEAEPHTARATPVFDWDGDDFNINGTFKLNRQAVEDFVVGRGTTGIWTWERWNSGLVKCWGQTAERLFEFIGEGPVFHSNTVHSTSYPFALTELTSISANIVSPGYLVPVVLSTEETIRTTFIRLYGNNEPVIGHYTFTVVGKWK